MSALEVVLTGQDRALCDAWRGACGDASGVSVFFGSILDVETDAVVSPANSFGFMRGGIDAVYVSRFGAGIEERLQDRIRIRHHGELLVGEAEIVATGDEAIRWLIAAPTMRVPMDIRGTVNPYLAARAVLLLVTKGRMPYGAHAGEAVIDHVKTVAFPGLGTGTGGVSPEDCARQVRAAYDGVLGGSGNLPQTPGDAVRRHRSLFPPNDLDGSHETV